MTAQFEVGPRIGGIRWRRCLVCSMRVWETKRGKLCRHVAQPVSKGDDPLAATAFADHITPRCKGSGS